MHYIYLIYSETNGHGQWKIGITKNNPNLRYKQLKTANPNLKNLHYYQVNSEFGWNIETHLKKRFRYDRIDGEWIRYESINVKMFKELCKQIEDNLIKTKKYRESDYEDIN